MFAGVDDAGSTRRAIAVVVIENSARLDVRPAPRGVGRRVERETHRGVASSTARWRSLRLSVVLGIGGVGWEGAVELTEEGVKSHGSRGEHAGGDHTAGRRRGVSATTPAAPGASR